MRKWIVLLSVSIIGCFAIMARCTTMESATAGSDNIGTATKPMGNIVANAVSNDTGQVVCSNLVVRPGGTVSGSDTIAADAIAAGTMANSMIISNTTSQVIVSNVTVQAGAKLTVGAGGTVTVPANSISPAALATTPTGATVTQLVGQVTYTNVYSAYGVLLSHTP